ncbi:ATP-binding protein [Methanococcoides burtonii]|uniref:ATP-binding protein n=1 Tax=Methanococcoides burtonii TaxID=29291 RepID=UPI0018DE7BFF|nr:ATP-binding protein [Methanococcoides burtonii]
MYKICSICIFALLLITITSTPAVATGEIVRIGIEEYAPIAYVDDNGFVKGFNVDIIEYIAREEGWEIEYVPSTWSECIDNLESGEINLIITMIYTEERDEKYDYASEPFITDWAQLFIRSNTGIHSITDLEGTIISGITDDQTTTWFKEHAERYELEYELIETNSVSSSLEPIDDGTATAVILSRISGNALSKEHGIEGAPIESLPIEIYAATLEGNDQEILVTIGKHLEVMKEEEDSFYYTTYDKWFPTPTANAIPNSIIIIIASITTLTVIFIAVNLILRRTIQKRADEINQAEEKYSVLVEESNDGIIIVQNYLIVFANLKFAEMLGYEKDRLIKTLLNNCINNALKNEVITRYEQLIQGRSETEQQYETNFFSHNGENIPVEINSSLIHYRGNRAVMYIMRDITKRKQQEQDLLNSRQSAEVANHSKNTFLASMSHDLRTPLNAIIGYSDLLLTESVGDLNEKQIKYTNNILISGRLLLNIINDILNISKIEAGKMQLRPSENDIQEILKEVNELVKTKVQISKNELIFNIENGIEKIYADRIKIISILQNLVDNAIKHSPKNEKIFINITTKDKNLQICVKNKGKGITQEMQKEIFTPFVQVEKFISKEYRGTGLGLAIVKHYVHLHNGKIWIESVLGEETSFIFTIPQHYFANNMEPERSDNG